MAIALFTIDSINSPITNSFLTLKGKKDSSTALVSINGDYSATEYPDPSSWEYAIHLSIGANTITIQGTDTASNRSSTNTLYIQLSSNTIKPFLFYNYLDDKAAESSVTRLPGEKNLGLRNRVLDAGLKPGGTNYIGLINGVSRELSLKIIDSVFTITPTLFNNQLVRNLNNAFIIIEPTRILIEGDELVVHGEKVRINPGNRQATLAQLPVSKQAIKLTTLQGKVVNQDDYSIVDQTLTVLPDNDLLLAEYKYYLVVSTINKTLATLATDITALQTPAGATPFTCSITSGYSTSSAAFLIRLFRTAISNSGLILDLSKLQITNLNDSKYATSLLNTTGTYLDTKLEAFAEKTRVRSHIFLRDTIMDLDSLTIFSDDQDLSALPNIFDPLVGYYKCSNPNDSNRYTYFDYVRGSGICPNHSTCSLSRAGVLPTQLQSGRLLGMRMVDVR